MRITIGNGSRRQSVEFATGKGWERENSDQVCQVLRQAGLVFKHGAKYDS